jgi:hypothetical protein
VVKPIADRLKSVAPDHPTTGLLADGVKVLVGDEVVEGVRSGVTNAFGRREEN